MKLYHDLASPYAYLAVCARNAEIKRALREATEA